jgi:hypothetical protein
MIRSRLATAVFVVMAAACGGPAQRTVETPQQVIAWKAVGSWSGRGNRQTESFRSDSGALRVRWTASPAAQQPENAGAIKVTAHSAISGRLLEQVVDHHGAGSGTGFVNQDPHVFYLIVESDHLDWTVSVEEAFAGSVTAPR